MQIHIMAEYLITSDTMNYADIAFSLNKKCCLSLLISIYEYLYELCMDGYIYERIYGYVDVCEGVRCAFNPLLNRIISVYYGHTRCYFCM